jgi:hypothetical protein
MTRRKLHNTILVYESSYHMGGSFPVRHSSDVDFLFLFGSYARQCESSYVSARFRGFGSFHGFVVALSLDSTW